MKRRIFAVTVLAMLTVASSAFALGKGSSTLSLGLGQNQAVNYITDKFDETNIGLQFNHMFSDDYQLAISGAWGFGNSEFKDSDPAFLTDNKLSMTSYRFRVGGDRVGKIGDRFVMYIGPGIEFSSSTLEFESIGFPKQESEATTFYGISGRVGGIMMLSPKVGITGEISHAFGMASAEDGTEEYTWSPNTFGAFWGLTFAFGGAN